MQIIFKIVFLVTVMCGAIRSYGVITIDSAASTSSHCANDGTITIYGRSGSSMIYAIIAGPDIRPAQSGNRFAALPQGSYQVLITNFSNDTAYASAIVGGNYVFPDFAPTFTNPTCPGSATGVIVAHPQAQSGLPPYSWIITNTGTGATTTQLSDTFYNLAGGDYSIRMFDSCSGFATRYVTLTDPGTSFTLQNPIYNNMIACDTDVLQILLWPTHGFLSPPFIVTVYSGNSVYIDTFSDAVSPGTQVLILYDTIGGAYYGMGYYVSVTNGCGEIQTVSGYIDAWGANVSIYPINDSCISRVSAGFTMTNQFYSRTSFHAPITFRLWDITSGTYVLVDSTVFIYNTGYYSPTYFLEPNHRYYMTVNDTCGHISNQYFVTPVADTSRVATSTTYEESCLDSTGGVSIHCYNYSRTSTRLTILSGPPLARSTKAYFAHRDTIIYPITDYIRYTCSGYSANEVCFGVGGLPVGLYRFRVEDSCGRTHTDTFSVRPEDIIVYDYRKSVTKGCPGQNKINYVIHRSRNYMSQDYLRIFPLGSPQARDSTTLDSSSFANLNAGTYVLEHFINKYHYFNLLAHNMPCNILRDTVIVPPYQLPRVDYATQVKCNGAVNVGLLPDSNTGVPPYSYEILSGPQVAGLQSSNFFVLRQPGTYVARISDTCGFARAFTFAVDTLSFAQIVKVGSSCLGNTATLVGQRSPYATYHWHRPNGTVFIGDSLRLNPVLPADYGMYQIVKYVSVNGCRDTFYTNYTLNSGGISINVASICRGQSFVFAGQSYSQAGVYYDTITTPLCDSIIVLTLSIAPPRYDSATQTICAGRNVTVGAHVYNTSGIYRDTFTTAGCDSIHVLNLIVSPIRQDSVVRSICPGQSVAVGTHTYNVSGIYRDTFSVGGCDSIHVLNLLVNGLKRDSVSQTVCSGQSVTVGAHIYTLAGIYADTLPTATCDSVHILNLQIGGMKRDSASQNICTGQSVTVGPHVYTATGIYRDTFTTAGCDSVYILNLQVSGMRRDSVSLSICTGQAVTVGSNVYTATGLYRDTFTTAGCDSVYILNLLVDGVKRDSVSQTICPGQSVTVGSHIYSIPGIYRDTFTTVGCDSVHVLNLQYGGARFDSVSQSICPGQSVTVGSHVYSSAGIYRDTLITASGCDSVHILNLQIGGMKRDSVSQSICPGQSMTVGSHVYSSAGIYRDTLITASGCDSVHILNLQIGGMKRDSVSQSICPGQSVTVGSHVYSSAGIYRDTLSTASGCDSVHILNLQIGGMKRDSVSQSICPGQSVTVGSHVYSGAGIYRDTLSTASGCDSVHILNLQIGGAIRDTVDIGFCEGGSIAIGGTTYTQAAIRSDTFSTTGCDSIRVLRINVLSLPNIHITASASEVSPEDTVQLNVSGGAGWHYHWTSSAALSNEFSRSPTAMVTGDSWIIVEASDGNNCTAADSIFIKVGDCDGTLFVPNAFTPNGDGNNDIYRVFGRCVRLHTLKIFNRWGEKVWETEDIEDGWDGTYRGAVQPPGVYVYMLSYTPLSQKSGTAKTLQGSIALIR